MYLKKSLILVAAILVLFTGTLHAVNRDASANPKQYRLRLYHLHTGEHIDVVYRIGNRYLPNAVAELDHFLRDHRTGDVKDYDVKEFDLLHHLMARLGHPDGQIDIVCGYRTPSTCASMDTALRSTASTWKPKPSTSAFPECPPQRYVMPPWSFIAAGVDYYAESNFVHVDVDRVRHW